jgi:hypothetical protein
LPILHHSNKQGTHWVALIASRNSANDSVNFFCYNSAPGLKNPEWESLGKRLLIHLLLLCNWKESLEEKEISDLPASLVQKDVNSCGLYVCYFGEMLAHTTESVQEFNNKLKEFDLSSYKAQICKFLKEEAIETTTKHEVVELLQSLKTRTRIKRKGKKTLSTNDTEVDTALFVGRGVEVRESKLVKGEQGVFAVERIKKDELFLEMKGEQIDEDEFQKRFISTT